MNQLQSFTTDAERSAWIIEHADYFNIVRFKGVESPSQFDTLRVPTDKWGISSLTLAIEIAEGECAKDPSARILIYAVSGVQSCYVKTIKGSQT